MPAMNDTAHGISRLVVRQQATMLVNRYTIHPVDDAGNEAPAIAAAQQKRLALKERVTFYADEQRSRALFGFEARSSRDLGATYDVKDADGRHRLVQEGLPQVAHALDLAHGRPRARPRGGRHRAKRSRRPDPAGLEPSPRRPARPVAVSFRLPYGRRHAGHVVRRRRALRDVYDLELPATSSGSRLDRRLGAAMAVALDALQAR
jgi:hypothetical protein